MASEFINQVQQLLERIPPVTRYALISMITLTVLCLCELLSLSQYALSFHSVFYKRELYRLISNFLFVGTKFDFVFNLYSLYQHGSFLENHVFQRNTKSYIIYLLKIILIIDTFSLLSGIGSFLFSSLSCAMAYTWSLYNAYQTVQVFFVFQLPGKYLPYCLLGMSLISGGLGALIVSGFGILAGLIVSKLGSLQPNSGFSVHAPSNHSTTSERSSTAFKGRGKRLGG
ncbi:Der1-like family protein [Schizosaccharomyces cryophilus OY26]|uniref:Derlin n=1 Tax=Schizosaccharomyces cryophilus (strain OY26 / ATCC MYA-4695 / CBS 11777 / NBRC 106824 / NRRL Y48691) TaxID=653667 RepID=S9XCS8_SCHCR|nr:Der1-like family protein [Schizosaccharomyces cryophilus OY26]EPY51651.1 Der1-like family protein [Schizosaccharomyces cryophilus OY26]